jgi:hypothetical protein
MWRMAALYLTSYDSCILTMVNGNAGDHLEDRLRALEGHIMHDVIPVLLPSTRIGIDLRM